jgi:CBS domain-containing protein
MTTPIHCLRSDALLQDALLAMQQQQVRRLPVLDPEGELTGTVR